jgi:hypothetical protein
MHQCSYPIKAIPGNLEIINFIEHEGDDERKG